MGAGLIGLTAGCSVNNSKIENDFSQPHLREAIEVDHATTRTETYEEIPTGITLPNGEELIIKKKHINHDSSTILENTTGLGWGENGSWNNEFFRSYNRIGLYDNDGEKRQEVWSDSAIRGSLILGRLQNEAILFGSVGDREGIGFQTQHTLKDKDGNISGTLTLNYDRAMFDESKDPERYGFDLDVALNNKFPKVNVGGAFDRVKTVDDKTDFFLGRARIQPSETDKFNIAYELADSDINGQTNTGIFVWTHLGKDEKWGTRTRVEGSSNRDTDTKTGKLEVYLVQNPSSGHAWGDACTSRNNGDVRARNVTPNALDIELPTTAGRSSKGLATRFLLDYKQVEDKDMHKVRGEIGYVWDLRNGKNFSITPYAEHVSNLDGQRGNGYGIDFNYGKPDFFFELTLGRKNIGNVEDTTAYMWIGKSIFMGNKGRK